jgi:periplasmic copper chaperone A
MKYFIAFVCLLSLSLTACQKKEVTMMVHEPQSFETAKGMKVGAAIMVLHNKANKDDELIRAETPLTSRVELHTMSEENGIMKMREVKSIPIKASEYTTLSPSGYHIMLMDLSKPLKADDEFQMTFYFKNSAPVTATIPIASRKNLQQKMEYMNHGQH